MIDSTRAEAGGSPASMDARPSSDIGLERSRSVIVAPESGETTEKTRPPDLEPGWLEVIGDEFQKPYMAELRAFLLEEKKRHRVFPPMKDVFNAFWLTPFSQVRVVILGQDPYHGPGQAHGLCFSVQPGVEPPPSLQNIFRELNRDLQIPLPANGDLRPWTRQGVMLLNTVLTVRAHQAHSHAGQGWEQFTDRVIRELNARGEGLVFVLWGRPAQSKIPMIDTSKHLVLKAPHPSPLSAHMGFIGCGHFSAINRHLEHLGQPPIDWSLPA